MTTLGCRNQLSITQPVSTRVWRVSSLEGEAVLAARSADNLRVAPELIGAVLERESVGANGSEAHGLECPEALARVRQRRPVKGHSLRGGGGGGGRGGGGDKVQGTSRARGKGKGEARGLETKASGGEWRLLGKSAVDKRPPHANTHICMEQ